MLSSNDILKKLNVYCNHLTHNSNFELKNELNCLISAIIESACNYKTPHKLIAKFNYFQKDNLIDFIKLLKQLEKHSLATKDLAPEEINKEKKLQNKFFTGLIKILLDIPNIKDNHLYYIVINNYIKNLAQHFYYTENLHLRRFYNIFASIYVYQLKLKLEQKKIPLDDDKVINYEEKKRCILNEYRDDLDKFISKLFADNLVKDTNNFILRDKEIEFYTKQICNNKRSLKNLELYQQDSMAALKTANIEPDKAYFFLNNIIMQITNNYTNLLDKKMNVEEQGFYDYGSTITLNYFNSKDKVLSTAFLGDTESLMVVYDPKTYDLSLIPITYGHNVDSKVDYYINSINNNLVEDTRGVKRTLSGLNVFRSIEHPQKRVVNQIDFNQFDLKEPRFKGKSVFLLNLSDGVREKNDIPRRLETDIPEVKEEVKKYKEYFRYVFSEEYLRIIRHAIHNNSIHLVPDLLVKYAKNKGASDNLSCSLTPLIVQENVFIYSNQKVTNSCLIVTCDGHCQQSYNKSVEDYEQYSDFFIHQINGLHMPIALKYMKNEVQEERNLALKVKNKKERCC